MAALAPWPCANGSCLPSALLLGLIGVSTTGYRLIGGPSVSFLQALYMAVITLAGVGYGEIVDTSHNPALRVFNIGIVLFGVAITVYVFSVVAAFLVEVEFTQPFLEAQNAATH